MLLSFSFSSSREVEEGDEEESLSIASLRLAAFLGSRSAAVARAFSALNLVDIKNIK